jgi:hypothetical protein
VAVCLIYVMLTKLLGWIVLRARADAAKEIEILVLRHQLGRSDVADRLPAWRLDRTTAAPATAYILI